MNIIFMEGMMNQCGGWGAEIRRNKPSRMDVALWCYKWVDGWMNNVIERVRREWKEREGGIEGGVLQGERTARSAHSS